MEQLEAEMPARRVSEIGNYTREFISLVLAEIETGVSPTVASLKYNVNPGTLDYWLMNYTSDKYRQSRRKFISVEEKRAIIKAVQNGSMTIREAMRVYNLNSHTTIKRWILKEKKEMNDLVGSNLLALKKEQTNDHSQDQKPVDETEVLRQKLADAQLKIAALNTLIDVAEEQLKINIRKKPGAKRL
jgi:transposase